MRVLNRHFRHFPVPPARVAPLLDSLSSDEDALWPHERWPPIRFDGPLEEGRAGGHGPIRYSVEAYEPGRRVLFRFSSPDGFRGSHSFWVEERGEGCVLQHLIDMEVSGSALLSWPLVFRPLHDALLEDGLDKAGARISGSTWKPRRLSPWVRILRRALRRRRTGG